MDNTKPVIDEIILAYLNQDLDPAGQKKLAHWLTESPDHPVYFRQTCEAWLLSGSEKIRDRYDAERAYALFRAEHEDEFDAPETSLPRRRHSLLAVGIAAALLLLLSTGAFLTGLRQGQDRIESRFGELVIEAPWGSSSEVVLPDGTKVMLNAGSRLSYSQGFGIMDRDIRLSGEACFDVAHNESLPMRVASSDMVVRVVGTRFNFRDYPEDLEAIISLQEGKVALLNKLQPDQAEKYLNPNQRIVLDKHSGQMHIESKDAANAMQWTEGNLFFDEVLLSDIARDLERYYDVHISLLGDELQSMRVYATFVRREMSIEKILELLSATDKISYRIDGREVTIRPRH